MHDPGPRVVHDSMLKVDRIKGLGLSDPVELNDVAILGL